MLRPPLLAEAEALLIASRPLSAPDPVLRRDFVMASRQAYDEEQPAIAQSQANLLALVGDAERERGNLNTALQLCVHATREAQRRSADPSRAAAALAAAVCRLDWRLILTAHESSVYSTAFSLDGTRIVTASSDHTARIRYAASGAEILGLRGYEQNVLSAAFSPDGRRVITASADKTARLRRALHDDVGAGPHHRSLHAAAARYNHNDP